METSEIESDPAAEPVSEAIESEPEVAIAEPEELSILAVRDTVLFPGALLPLSVGRPASVSLVESLGENRLIGVVSQVDPRTDLPDPNDLHELGTVAIIHKIVRMREGQLLFCACESSAIRRESRFCALAWNVCRRSSRK